METNSNLSVLLFRTGCNYASICKIVTNGTDVVSGLANLAQKVYGQLNPTCLPIVVDDNSGLLNTTISGGQERIWEYQTCNEFGFYQVCDPDSLCPFTSEPHYNNLEFYLNQCKLAFGITGDMVEKKVKETNRVSTYLYLCTITCKLIAYSPLLIVLWS